MGTLQADLVTLSKFCCVEKQMDTLKKFESLQQMVDVTKQCFNDVSITFKEQIGLIFYFIRNSSNPYDYKNCESISQCNAATTTPNIIYILVWVFMLILIVTSNLTVIAAVKKISYLNQNVTNLFISSLAVSDLLVGLFIIPIKIKYTYNNLRFCAPIEVCRFYLTSDNALFSASITNLFVITMDRYIALNYPYKYPRWITARRGKFIIFFIWVYGSIWGLLSNLKWDNFRENSMHIKGHQCLQNNNYIYTIVVYVFIFYIPVLIMGMVYYRILMITRYHARSISSTMYGESINNNDSRRCSYVSSQEPGSPQSIDSCSIDAKKYISDKRHVRSSSKATQMIYYRKMVFKASKTVAVVYGTFFLCWFPVSALSLAISFCQNCFRGLNLTWFYIIFVEVLPMFNSVLNPFIYALMNKQYRMAFKAIFKKIFGQIKLSRKKSRSTKAMTVL